MKSRDPNPETRVPKPESRNPNPETRNPKSETRNPNPETLIPKLRCNNALSCPQDGGHQAGGYQATATFNKRSGRFEGAGAVNKMDVGDLAPPGAIGVPCCSSGFMVGGFRTTLQGYFAHKKMSACRIVQ